MKLIVDLLNICDYFNFQQAKGKNKKKTRLSQNVQRQTFCN